MTITELIKELEETKRGYGDLEVMVDTEAARLIPEVR